MCMSSVTYRKFNLKFKPIKTKYYESTTIYEESRSLDGNSFRNRFRDCGYLLSHRSWNDGIRTCHEDLRDVARGNHHPGGSGILVRSAASRMD